MGLAIHIAKRFSSNQRRDDDLEQVALLALVKALDHFDPDIGVPFSAFAGRTIEGELKRHFRDATWGVAVPRSAKELHLAVRDANDALSVRLGHSPTVAEVAEYLEISTDDVIVGMSATRARSIDTIDPPSDRGSSEQSGATAIGERGYADVENEALVDDLIATLPAREQEIIRLRFYEGLSQLEIGERIGVSQMHVSRLLRNAFEALRDEHRDDA